MTPLFSSLLGACIGSFLNVCLVRWKDGGQVLTPPSFCPRCKNAILWFDNIPVVSFLLLKGKCRFCNKSISFQYPIIEIATALLFGISCQEFSQDGLRLLSSFVFVSFLILLVASDLKWKLLPHPFNNLFILSGFLFFFAQFNGSNFFHPVSAFIVIGSLVFGLAQFFSKGLGGGDIKMIAGLAVWVGVMKTLLVLVFACLTASVVFFALLITGKVSWKWMIPFGPFLALGALGVWFWPQSIQRVRMIL